MAQDANAIREAQARRTAQPGALAPAVNPTHQGVDDRIAAQLDAIPRAASAGFGAVEGQLQGTGEPIWIAWRELTEQASSLTNIADNALSQIHAIRSDETKPAPWRAQVAGDTRTAAGELIDATNRLTQASLDRFEAHLVDALMPRPSSDAAVRTLKRQEVDRVVARAGNALALARQIGRDPALDSELLGDWGKAILSDEDFRALRAASVAMLIHQAGGSERQQRARAALVAFHGQNLRKHATALYHAARTKLAEPAPTGAGSARG